MNRTICLLPLFLFQFSLVAQSYADSIAYGVQVAREVSFQDAYTYFLRLEQQIPPKDTNRLEVTKVLIELGAELEQYFRENEEFEKALPYSQKIYALLKANQKSLPESYTRRFPFALKNQVVSHVGLGQYEEADVLRRELYRMNKKGELPDGIDEYFNFDFFRLDSLNIWGYEWFEPLPKNRFNRSFSKVVYYIYSTDEAGQDKDQLYRLHVLMFHGEAKFDYVLTKRLAKATGEVSGTLYCYTYQEEIDFAKLKADVVQVVQGNLNPCMEDKE